MCFLPTETIFVHCDQEGWLENHASRQREDFEVEPIFQNVHNFFNNLVQFSAQIVFHCEVRRLKPFAESAYKNTNILLQRYSTVQQTGPPRNG